MLVEFRVANHRSLRDEQVLTMEAGRVGDETDPRPRRVAGYPEKLLTVAGLYGANASGKSNVLAALSFMRDAILMPTWNWLPGLEKPRGSLAQRDPFAWGPRKIDPSLFEVTFLLDRVRYQYGFQVSDERFLEEWLYAWPSGRKQVWFEREDDVFKFGENLRGENKVIEKVTRPDVPFLSVAVQHNHQQLAPVFEWFNCLEVLGRERRMLREEEFSKWFFKGFRELLKQADTGVVDLRVERSPSDDRPRRLDSRFSLKHKSDSDDAWLPLEEESNGTQTLFHMALPILWVLQRGSVLLVDELERSLHPSLARRIIDRFNDPAANAKNAQIIFTTHDTNLLGRVLGEPALRRDQVWLTEKDAEGATVLYPLTDYKPRKNENLERGYLQGRYGAIPFLNDFLAKAE